MQVPGVAAANGSTLILKDNSTVKVDAIVFCTGYLYSMPFLDKSSGLQIDDNYVNPLYKYLLNGEHPSMAFVGLALDVALFPLVDVQVKQRLYKFLYFYSNTCEIENLLIFFWVNAVKIFRIHVTK